MVYLYCCSHTYLQNFCRQQVNVVSSDFIFELSSPSLPVATLTRSLPSPSSFITSLAVFTKDVCQPVPISSLEI